MDLPTGVLTSATQYYVTATNEGCSLRIPSSGSVTVGVYPTPAVTLGANPEVCRGATSTSVTYAITAGGPDRYSIDFDATAEGEGFVDVADAALSGGEISITVPAAASALTYSADVTVANSLTGCVSEIYTVLILVQPTPTITLGSNPEVCGGTATTDLSYSATTETPVSYSIDFNATANLIGFVDVVDNILPASPVSIDVPIGATAAIYNANLNVSTLTCTSSNYPITVTVLEQPTITLGSNPTVCSGTTTTNLTYSAVSGSPDEYRIDYDATAEAGRVY